MAIHYTTDIEGIDWAALKAELVADDFLRRLDRLTADLGLDRERAAGWTIAQTIAWAFSSGHAEAHYETVRHLLDR